MPDGTKRPAEATGGQLLADDEAGLGLEAPVGEAGELVLTEPANVRDGVVDRCVDVRWDGRRLDLGAADPQLLGRSGHSVEASEGVADGVVATLAHVVDQPTDRLAQLWIEDGVEASPTQRRPRLSSMSTQRCVLITAATARDGTGAPSG